MAKYKAYPEYKDSGVEWIDSIPSYWEVKPTFALCDASTQKNIDGVQSNVLSLSYGNIIPRDVETNFGLLPESFNTYQIISCGDVILRLTDLQNDKNSLRVGLAKQKGIITSAYLKLKANSDINPNFLYRLLHSYDTTKVFYGMGGGLRQSMKFEDFRRLPLLLPPYEEQIKISVFLDHETAKIDNLIEKQQQLIELLKEKRQAVISHAVTKGLNPDVPMKDSGVEWLGEVPKHWKCGYLRWYISVSSGTYLNNKDFETDESNDCMNPVIGGNGVMGFTSKINDGNCLVVGRVGALCGNVHQIRRACWVTDNALKIIYGCDFDVDYLEMYLKVLDLNKLANHNAQPLITGTMIKEQVAIIPSIDEQKNITKFIQSKVGKIDLLIRKSSETVDKIKERRTALISAAVTGKIDVRDWVAPDTRSAEVHQEATA